jgi:hypothetical protein
MKYAAPLLMVLAAPAAAQTLAEAPSLGWIHGEWDGTATIFGRPATVSLSVTPVLMGGATALTYRVQMPASATQPEFRFEGRGTYRVAKDGRVVGQWNDSQGNFHSLAGRVTGTSMAVTWGEPRTEVGHSTYALAADGTLSVTDAEFGRGQLRVFSTQSYRKK